MQIFIVCPYDRRCFLTKNPAVGSRLLSWLMLCVFIAGFRYLKIVRKVRIM